MTNERGKALVLGTDTRSFLSVIRSLARKQIAVHVAWHSPDSPAIRSHYIRSIHHIPTPWDSPRGWKQPIRELLQAEQFDLVIPCNDPSLIPLQENRAELEAIGRIYLLDDRAYSVAFDKHASTQLAESLQIPVPRSRLIADAIDAARALEELGLPVIVKPLQSYCADRLAKRNHVVRIDSAADWERCLPSFLDKGVVQVQEFFAGIGAGVEFLADRGQIRTAFQHVRLHEPESGGGSSLRKSTPIDPDLLGATAKLMAALNYSGVGMVEFRRNPQTGQWVFVEINGRFWGSLPLAIACGADFPAYLYDYLVDNRSEFPRGYRAGLRCRNLERDLGWYRERVRSVFRRQVSLRTFGKELASELLGLLLLRERSDTFVIDDYRPGLAELGGILRKCGIRMQCKCSGAIRHLPPVKAWLRFRARNDLRRARRILFVCKGNICRSPFAEYYLRSVGPPSVEVRSCGYYPESGRSSPKHAQEAARHYGVDLAVHQSRVIARSDVEWSDIIFVFDEENRRTMRQRFPEAKGRTHLLGSLHSRGSLWIADPYSGTVAECVNAYRSIKAALDSTSRGPFEPAPVAAGAQDL